MFCYVDQHFWLQELFQDVFWGHVTETLEKEMY